MVFIFLCATYDGLAPDICGSIGVRLISGYFRLYREYSPNSFVALLKRIIFIFNRIILVCLALSEGVILMIENRLSKISVCMATFNGEDYIHDQITSIILQLSAHDELVISDDCSTDNTLDIARGFLDDRIRIVHNNNRVGYSSNFENAINNAMNDIIFLSDQDDIWMSSKVSTMISALDDCDLVVCNAQYVDKFINPLEETLFSVRGDRSGFLQNLYKLRYLGACMAFRRVIFDKLLPFPVNKKLCPHDMWIALIAEFYYKVTTIRTPLILYRRHDNNVSNGGVKSKNSLFFMIRFRVYALLMVLSRLPR